MRARPAGGRLRVIVVILSSMLLGVVVAPLPGFSHVGGTVNHLWKEHIRPKADARFSTVVTELSVDCVSVDAINQDYTKLADLGTFETVARGSMVEVTFEGRIFVSSFAAGTGAVFELRVDDAAVPGRARANLKAAEAGGSGHMAAFSGIWTGLAKGTHTVSMWVRTSSGGSGTDAYVDPGCWSTDKVVVKEFR